VYRKASHPSYVVRRQQIIVGITGVAVHRAAEVGGCRM